MPEDRDQLFEKALAKQLRSDRAEETLCLDPEALAAYHERMLSAEEMSAAKSHIAACSRCQEILAHLEASEEVSVLREEPGHEPVAVPVRRALSPAEEVSDEIDALPGAAPASESPAVSARAAVAIPSKRRRTYLWAVPAGAIAAMLLLWIGFEQTGRRRMLAPRDQEVTENRSAVRAPEESSEALKAVPIDRAPESPEKQKEMPRREASPSPELALRDRKKDSGRDKASSLPEPTSRYSAHARVAPGPSVANSQAQAADALERSAPAGQMSQTVTDAPATPELDSLRQQAPQSKAVAGGAGALKEPAPAAPPPPVPASPTNATSEIIAKSQALNGRDYLNLAPAFSKTGLDIRIAAPGGKKIWSVGPGGQILFSEDGGKLWVTQSSGVFASLTGGSAPSDRVCWISGTAGTLLRTTDRGKTWQAVHTPISGDLGGVHAADGKHASIWDQPNRTSYETSDGGITWKQVANE